MKKILPLLIAFIVALNGCANMSQGENTLLGAGAGAAGGALIGGLLGGGSGAAIGAAIGGLGGGMVGYFASDRYTKSVQQQANNWQQQTGAVPQPPQTTQVVENGKQVNQILSQKLELNDSQVFDHNKHLDTKVKSQLQYAEQESQKVGGSVTVVCPASANSKAIEQIKATGVKTKLDTSKPSGYTIILARNAVNS